MNQTKKTNLPFSPPKKSPPIKETIPDINLKTSESEISKSIPEDQTTIRTQNDDEKSLSIDYLKECLNKENCTQCKTDSYSTPEKKLNQKTTNSKPKSPVKEIKNSKSKTSPPKPIEEKKGCDCIEKDLPLKLNEMNVWQVCGANDCKLIQLKIDSFEAKGDLVSPVSKSTDTERTIRNSFSIFSDDTETKQKSKLNGGNKNKKSPKKLQSKSNFGGGDSIIYHDLKDEKNHINGDDTQRSEITDKDKSKPLGGVKKDKGEKKSKDDFTRENCDDCCFCNPKLHRKGTGSSTANQSCKFCKKKESERPSTESTSRTKTDDDYRSNLTYELLSKSDHTHTKTKIHDSDVTSTKCKKSNEKIKRKFLPDPHKLHVGSPYSAKSNISSSSHESLKRTPSPSNRTSKPKQLNRSTRESNTIPRTKSLQSIQKTEDLNSSSFRNTNEKNSNKSKSQNLRLPSPYATTELSSHKDYDSSSVSDMSMLGGVSPKHNQYNELAHTAANRWRSHIWQKQTQARKWAPKYDDMASQRARAKWGPKVPIDAPGNNPHQGNFIVFG